MTVICQRKIPFGAILQLGPVNMLYYKGTSEKKCSGIYNVRCYGAFRHTSVRAAYAIQEIMLYGMHCKCVHFCRF